MKPKFPGVGWKVIALERKRQVDKEHYYDSHDDCHGAGELARAGAAYALPKFLRETQVWNMPLGSRIWPWEDPDWKPTPDRIKELAKAGALIAAEIDRLVRAGFKIPKRYVL